MWFRKRSYESSVTRWEAEKFAPNSILHVTVWWKAVENMVNHVYELKKWMENSRPLKVRPRARGLFILCLFRRALSCCRKITLQQHSKECCCKALICFFSKSINSRWKVTQSENGQICPLSWCSELFRSVVYRLNKYW